MKITRGLYRIIHTSRKQGAHDIKRLKCVLFDRTKTKTHVSCFHVEGDGDGGKEIPFREGVGMQSPFKVDRQSCTLHSPT